MTLRSRAIRRAGLAVVGGVLGVAVVAAPTAAHTDLIGSSPADKAVLDTAPTEVVLEFNQPVQTDFGLVAVIDATGTHHELGEPVAMGSTVTQPLHPLDAGAYEISYRIGSADGHPVAGTLTFTVSGTIPDATSQASRGSVPPSPSSSDPSTGADHDDHASASAEPVASTDADAGGTSPLLLGAGGVAAVAALAAVVFFAMGGRGPRQADGGEGTGTAP
ncbi:MAG TPA: copper resistance CopC family protein [Jiangellaceae bacterium]|nr:copper resistance CopC family protein [Jiangellaceae bacterium]